MSGWSISLYESDNYIGVNHSITLYAYSNQDVGPSPWWIEIYNQSTGAVLGYPCATGTYCSASFAASSAGTRSFVAYVASYSTTNPPDYIAAVSNAVSCTWITINSLTASPQYLAPNQATTITVSANVDVGPTPYWLEIFDATTGANLAICARGWSCSASETQYGSTKHVFAGYISSYGTSNPPPSVQSSASVNAYWMSVTISASPLALSPGGTTHLVATTNYDVGPSPYYISIFDTTTNTRVGTPCPSGTSCAADYTINGSTVRDFFAYIGGNGTSSPPYPVLMSSNNYQEVSWITISLQVTPPLVALGAQATVTAYTSLSMSVTNYYIQLYDRSTSSYLTECGLGSTCSTSVTESSPTTQQFIAFVDSGTTFTYPPGFARATSTVNAASWVTVSLRSCNYAVSTCPSGSWTNGTVINAKLTLTATTQVDVNGTGYAIQIMDPNGNILASCPAGSSCSIPVSETAAGNYVFGAQVAVPNSYPQALAAYSTASSLKWVQAWKPWAPDSSASGFGNSSQWDYSYDPSGSAGEYGIDIGVHSLVYGSAIYAPEAGYLSYEPSTGWWPPGRLVLQLTSGGIVGFGHLNPNPNLTLPVQVSGGTLIGYVACSANPQHPMPNCDNSHTEFMYEPSNGDTRNIWNFRPPASPSNPLYATNGCPLNTYSYSGGTGVDPCAWLSAYLVYGT